VTEITRRDDGEVSYSIQSAADETHLGKCAMRLIVESEDCHIVINDSVVTSHGPRFQLVRDGTRSHIHLTVAEAEWLIQRLKDVVWHVRGGVDQERLARRMVARP
jgi:hypothetical protein